jgi:crotonobetainyl-CoA:carnitine CoA-transferase CaiB-like acyl-CoA transferase
MGVLDGIKVLEMARVPPAELPGMFLADMGADVLKIETPPDVPEPSEPAFTEPAV